MAHPSLLPILAQADEILDLLKIVAQYAGMPAAMMAVALFAIYKNWFITGNAHNKLMEVQNKMMDRSFRECDEAKTELRHERERYFALLSRHHTATERAVAVIDRLSQSKG